MTQSEADRRFLCDYMKHSQLAPGLRSVTAYMSFALLRLGAPFEKPLKIDEPVFIDQGDKRSPPN